MRVQGVEAIPIDIPLSRDFGGSTYSVLKRSTVITRVRTDQGLVSDVYNGDNREHGSEIARLIHEALAPRIIGASIFESERIWDDLFALSHASRDRKTLLEAIACVDCALWDLVGKREALLHQIQQIMYERVRLGPIYEYVWPSGIGPRVAEPALLLINPYPWSAPLEEVRLKKN